MGGIIIMIFFFSNTHWTQQHPFMKYFLKPPFASLTSLIHNADEVTEHLTRDQRHFFIQNLSRSFRFTSPWRSFFSSVHLTRFLQGSGQRTGMDIAEAWFSAQLFLRIVFGLLYCWKIQTWPIIRFLTEAVTCWFFICWYLIESMMPCVYKMSRTSSWNIGPQYLYTSNKVLTNT